MKRVLSLILALTLVFSLAACSGKKADVASDAPADADTQEGTTNGDDSDVIIIGGLAPLNGPVSQYGIATNNGAKLAVEEVNAAGGVLGKQIKYIVEDEQGDPTQAISAYQKLVQNDKIVALVGDVTTKPTIAVAQLAADDNMPMITGTATGEAVTTFGDNIFRACFIDPYQGTLMAHYAQEKLGATTAAVLYDSGDDYSSGVADAFKETAEQLGIEVTNFEGYSSGIDDFNAQLTKIKESKPQVIMAPTYYEDASKIIKQARDLGIDAAFLGSDGWDGVLNQMEAEDYDVLKDCFFCSQYSPQSEKEELVNFMANYKETYDMEENMFAVLGYDAMKMMLQSIEEAGSTDPDAIKTAMAALTYDGLTGTTVFDEFRNPVREAYITAFVDGESVVKETYSFD